MREQNTDFDQPVERRNTDCLKYDFAVERGKPADVLPLWVADMDFKTSSFIIDAVRERAEHGVFGYTETGERYYEAAAAWLKKHHGMETKREWLIKTPGVVFALAMAVKAFTRQGDAVLIQQPVYYPFSEVIRDNNRTLVSSDLVLAPDGTYHIDFDDFEQKIRDNKVKLFLFCSPHNPVGRVWTIEEQKKIAKICLAYDVIVVSDEIHEDFTFKGHRHVPFVCADERAGKITVTATSPAKTFNLAGLQISNIFIEDEKLRSAFAHEVAAAGYSQCNAMGITACEAAYRYGEEWYEALMEYLEANLAYVREYVRDFLPGVRLIEPEGTYLLWLDFRGLGLTQDELEDMIINKAKLWLDSGAIFGKTGEGFERINIATRRAVLEEALERIRREVASLGL